ncbi:hypothetical protein CR513_25026, partial [Mucuna pruriens]
MEAEKRHRKAEARYMDDLKAAGKKEDELCRQLIAVKVIVEKLGGTIDETAIPLNFREVVIESFDGTQDPHTHLQAFQTQMYISGGNDRMSCKLFPGTMRGVAMNWLAIVPPRSIRSFNDIAISFASQFAANKVKCLEVTDLFDIRQDKGETLKSYLTRFNNATVKVNDPDKKFFMKAFQKGMRVDNSTTP